VNEDDQDDYLTDQEILRLATRHKSPVTISIDRSVNRKGSATTTICILAPDIREYDHPLSMAWQDRCAKILLIRSWRLPQQWGRKKVDINMAESLGFVLGAHTIPPGIPIMYVTDSNNARTLQRNLSNPHLFTHRKMVRKVKQGIDHTIANHLQLLTPPQHNWQDNSYEQELYDNGHENCQSWARLLNDNTTNEELLDNGDNSGEHNNNFNYHNSNVERGDDPSTSFQSDTLSGYFSDDSSSTASGIYSDLNADTGTNRYCFDDTMFDILPNILIVKVFSHQLDNEFISKCPGKNP